MALEERRPFRTEIYNYTKAGDGYWIDISISPIFDKTGVHTHFMAIERDITERRNLSEQTQSMIDAENFRQSERQLLSQTSEWLYSAKSLEELLMVVNTCMQTLMPEADGGLYIYSNSRDTLDKATDWGSTSQPAHLNPDECWALRRGRAYAYGTNAIEFPCSHIEDPNSPYFCLPIIAHGETIGLLHLCFNGLIAGTLDNTQLREFVQQRWDTALICAEQISLAIANVQLRQELQDQSIRDPLTNLWNRRWFLEAAHRDLKRAAADKEPLSLISIDVDHFKKFNDHHGHDAGDMVLRAVGALMMEQFQGELTPCRIGGEEFVVIAPDHDELAAELIAEAFRAQVSEIIVKYGGGQLPRITASIGIASTENGEMNTTDLLKIADEALYAAKAGGRDQTVRASKAKASASAKPGQKKKPTKAA